MSKRYPSRKERKRKRAKDTKKKQPPVTVQITSDFDDKEVAKRIAEHLRHLAPLDHEFTPEQVEKVLGTEVQHMEEPVAVPQPKPSLWDRFMGLFGRHK